MVDLNGYNCVDGFEKIKGEISNVGAYFEDCVGRVCCIFLNDGIQPERFVCGGKLFSSNSYDMV